MFDSKTPVQVTWLCKVCGQKEEIGSGKKPTHCGQPMTPVLVTAGKLHGNQRSALRPVTAP